MFRKERKCFLTCTILGFVTGLLMAFILPPVAIAVVECILIIVLCIALRR